MNTLSQECGPERPPAVLALCAAGLLAAALAVPTIFSSEARAVGDWYQVFLGWAAAATLLCVLGLWQLRRWAVYLYALTALSGQLVLIGIGGWRFDNLLFPGLFAAVAFSQLPKLR